MFEAGMAVRPTKFALIGPPSDIGHLYRILDWYRKGMPPRRFSSPKTALKLLEWLPAYKMREWESVRAASGKEVPGLMVLCPVIAEMVTSMEGEAAFKEHLNRRIFEAARVAAKGGGTVVALGAFTSIAMIGREEELAQAAGIAVTSGNTLTAWLTVRGLVRACERVDLDLSGARAAVVGASGDIGRGVCAWLAERVGRLTLVARRLGPVTELAEELRRGGRAQVEVAAEVRDAVRDADVVVAAAVSATPVVQAGEVKPGAVVCDVGYPKNVAAEMEGRRDVLAFGGGYAGLPVPLHFGYDIGLPCDEVLYGCFSESIVLALEGRNENFSTGRGGITAEKMEEIGAAALRHGFDVAPFYAGKRRLTDEDVEQVKEARRRRLAEEGR